jgi:branched-chain amino acid transport system substrate-binding protein
VARYSFRGLCVTVALCILLAACQSQPAFECTDTIGCVAIAPGEPVEIGVLQVLSGELGDLGMVQVRGVEMSAAELDDQLLGHPIKLHVLDSGCSSEAGINAALALAMRAQIVGVIGTYCSGSAVPASKVVSEAGMVMLSGTNAAPSLTSVNGKPGDNWQPGYLRTMYNGITMATMAATFAFQELGVTRTATINDGDDFTRELVQEFERRFRALGGKVVSSIGISKGDENMGPVLASIARSGPELIYLPVFEPEALRLITQARDVSGLEEIIWIGSGGLRSPSFFETAGMDALGLYLTSTKELATPSYDKLVSDYKARYGEQPSHFSLPYGYDAAGMLFAAIASVAVQEPDGTLYIGRAALREALYNTVDYNGITGRLTSDAFGDCFGGTHTMIRLDDPSAGIEGLTSNVVYTYTPEQ